MDSVKAFYEFQLKLMGRSKMVQNFSLILIPRKEEVKLDKKQKNISKLNNIICLQNNN
ncbi:MAG: hypothetical protein ACI33K_02510 [Clostridiaceae bacterium]